LGWGGGLFVGHVDVGDRKAWGDGDLPLVFRKVLFAELKGKWDAGKIGRSSLEMIETTLFDVEGSLFERVLCLLKLGDATDREF